MTDRHCRADWGSGLEVTHVAAPGAERRLPTTLLRRGRGGVGEAAD